MSVFKLVKDTRLYKTHGNVTGEILEWISCYKCRKWHHPQCVELSTDQSCYKTEEKNFLCVDCKSNITNKL